MIDIFERIVNEEFQFGDDAQLVAQTSAQFIAQFAHIVVDIRQDFCRTFRREYTQITAAYAQVGTDTHCAHRDQHAVHTLGLFLKNVAQFLLNES